MGFFKKNQVKRELTEEEEKEIKEEMLRQILAKSENDILMIKKIKDITNMNTGESKNLFMKYREELYNQINK